MEDVFVYLIGALAVPAIGQLKSWSGWTGKPALLISGAVAAAFGIGYLFFTGDVAFAHFTLENFPVVFGQVFAAATIVFKLLPANLKDRV